MKICWVFFVFLFDGAFCEPVPPAVEPLDHQGVPSRGLLNVRDFIFVLV